MNYTTIQNAATKIVDNLKIIDGSINALQNKQDIISTSDMSMANSHNGKLKIEEIGGKCEQVSTSGKNLLPISEYTTNASGGMSKYMDAPIVETGKSYILSGKTTDGITLTGGNSQVFFHDSEGKILDGTAEWFTKGVTINTDLSSATKFEVYTSESLAGKTIRIQLEEGSVVTDYEPYTGGIPAPNPDYPQEIKKVVVSEIKTRGKNLARSILPYVTTQYGAALYVDCDLQPSTQYTICFNGASGNTYYFNELLFNGPEYVHVDNGNTVATFTTKDKLPKNASTYSPIGAGWIFFKNSRDQLSDHVFTDLQLELGSVATDYEPYTESTIALSEPIELYGIGDVKDTIEDGKVVRRFASTVLDGTKNISRAPQERDNTTYRFYISDAHTEAQTKRYASNERPCILLDMLNPETTDRVYWSVEGISVASSGVFMLYHEKFKNFTVDQMREFLSNTPANVVYELATPVTEPLPAVDQIALNSLSTYDTVTYLDFDSEIEPTFQAEYGVTDIGGRVLEDLMTGLNSEILAQSDADRITALESTIVNNIQD